MDYTSKIKQFSTGAALDPAASSKVSGRFAATCVVLLATEGATYSRKKAISGLANAVPLLV